MTYHLVLDNPQIKLLPVVMEIKLSDFQEHYLREDEKQEVLGHFLYVFARRLYIQLKLKTDFAEWYLENLTAKHLYVDTRQRTGQKNVA